MQCLEERLLRWNLRRVADGRLAIDWHVSTHYTQIPPYRLFTYHENLLKHVGHVSVAWEGQISLRKNGVEMNNWIYLQNVKVVYYWR